MSDKNKAIAGTSLAAGTSALILTVILVGLGERIGELPFRHLFLSRSSLSMPAYMDLIRNEIPKNKQVFGVSLHSLIKRIPQALGPLLGGVLWLINPQVNLFAAAGFGFGACIIYGFFGKTIEKSEEKSEK